MLKQSQSVVFYTKKVLGSSFEEGLDVRSYCSSEQISEIVDLVADSIINGETFMKPESLKKYSTRNAMRRYAAGMVKNWFDKSKELNGGIKHSAKTPGTRRHHKDETIKNLKIMLKHVKGSKNNQAILEVQEAITARIAELNLEEQSRSSVAS